MIDFKEIPNWWPLCPGYECPQKDVCLRHMAFSQAPQNVERWACVLPSASAKGTCSHFQKAEKVKMACGFAKLWGQLRSRDARHDIRMALTEYFGSKGSYYRHKDGERLLTPRQQEEVERIIHNNGYAGEVVFDSYSERYDYSGL